MSVSLIKLRFFYATDIKSFIVYEGLIINSLPFPIIIIIIIVIVIIIIIIIIIIEIIIIFIIKVELQWLEHLWDHEN